MQKQEMTPDRDDSNPLVWVTLILVFISTWLWVQKQFLKGKVNNLERQLKPLKENEAKLRAQVQQDEQHSKANMEEKYDLIVGIGSPKSIADGWIVRVNRDLLSQLVSTSAFSSFSTPVQFHEADLAQFFQQDQWRGIVVSVVGGFDKGKSMILNKLVDTNFPSSCRVHTIGLSFKHIMFKKRHFNLLDTGGKDGPYFVEKSAEDSIDQAEATDKFISDIVFEVSDIFIFVVNEITAKEQTELHRLTRKLRESTKPFKDVLVVVNLKHASTLNEFEAQKQAHVKLYEDTAVDFEFASASRPGSLDVEEKSVPFLSGRGLHQRHFFMAKENTEVGDSINPWTISALRQHLFLHVVGRDDNSILDSVKDACTKFLPSYISVKEPILSVTPDQSDNDPSIQNRFLMKLENPPEIIETRRQTAYLHDYRRFGQGISEYVPAVDIRRLQNEYVFLIEAPGIIPGTCEIQGNDVDSEIVVSYTIDDTTPKVLERVQSQRRYGPVKVTLPVPREYHCMGVMRSAELKEGVIEIRCKLKEREVNTRVFANSSEGTSRQHVAIAEQDDAQPVDINTPT